MRGRDAVRDAGVVDLALGPHEALRHRRLGHEERAGDLGRGEAGERAQRERDLRLDRQRRVAAREDQAEPVVGDAAVVDRDRWVVGHQDGRLPCLRRAGLRAAQPVERAVAGGRREPGARVGGHAVARPPLERPREGVLRALLGEVPVARGPDQGGDDRVPTPPGTHGRLPARPRIVHGSTTSPRSGAPRSSRCAAPGIFDATSMASSRSLHSTR